MFLAGSASGVTVDILERIVKPGDIIATMKVEDVRSSWMTSAFHQVEPMANDLISNTSHRNSHPLEAGELGMVSRLMPVDLVMLQWKWMERFSEEPVQVGNDGFVTTTG